jgi:hypothetical protein
MFPLRQGLRGFPTTLEHLSGNMTRVCVSVPAKMRWKPGQHCYISVPGITAIGNHPFTIASIPYPEYYQGTNELVLLIRECGGFTKLLGAHARDHSTLDFSMSPSLTSPSTPGIYIQKRSDSSLSMASYADDVRISPSPSTLLSPEKAASRPLFPRSVSRESIASNLAPSGFDASRKSPTASIMSFDNLEAQRDAVAQVTAWIDGPFGEYARPLHRHYEGFITISGGSGLTASLPWIVYLTEKMRNDAARTETGGSGECAMKSVRFIWSIRKSEWIIWARRELIKALRAAAASNGRFEALIYVTSRDADEALAKAAQLDLMATAGVSEDNDRSVIEVRFGRPNMEEILPSILERRRNVVRGMVSLVFYSILRTNNYKVCGPNALKSGVANAVASLQSLVVTGKIESIALDSETFGKHLHHYLSCVVEFLIT